MVVADVEDAAVFPVVKSAEEVVFRRCGEVGCSQPGILMPTDVLRFGDVVGTVLPLCDRVSGMTGIVVMVNPCDIRREDKAVVFMDGDGGSQPFRRTDIYTAYLPTLTTLIQRSDY